MDIAEGVSHSQQAFRKTTVFTQTDRTGFCRTFFNSVWNNDKNIKITFNLNNVDFGSEVSCASFKGFQRFNLLHHSAK